MKHYLSLLLFLFTVSGICAQHPTMVGHRGCRYGVENTAAAFDYGATMGFKYLECDIRVTADSVIVISHDTDTKRLGGNLEIANATLDSLRAERYDQTRVGHRYQGGICTLDEYFDICRARGVKPLVELKWSTGINSKDCNNIPLLIDAIDRSGFRKDIIILTSMRPCLEYIRKNYPDITLQLLTNAKWEPFYDWCVEHKIDIDMAHDGVTPEAVKRFHDAGLKVGTWTVNRPEDYRRVAEAGVDFVTTDWLSPHCLPGRND